MDHLKNVCMSYIEHAKFSCQLSFLFFKGSLCAIFHAFFPCIFVKTSTEISDKIVQQIQNSGCKNGTAQQL